MLERRPDHRVRTIDGLRAISILWVICFHVIYLRGFFTTPAQYLTLAQQRILSPFLQGHFGVDVFFVISGYLIADILLREREATATIGLGRFYLRRATRILPAYVVVLFLSPLILRSRSNIDSAWTNLLFINNFIPVEKQALGWSWSLAIEEQFYFLFPVLLLLQKTPSIDPRKDALRTLRWLLGLLFLGVVIRAALIFGMGIHYPNPFHISACPQAFARYFDLVYDKPYGRYGGILCGVIVAYLERAETPLHAINRHVRLARLGVLMALLAVAWFATLPGYSPIQGQPGSLRVGLFLSTYRYVFSALIAYILLYTMARSRSGASSLLTSLLSSPMWRPIAELSYGAYLLHPLVIVALWAKLELPSTSLLQLGAVGAAGLVLTFAFALPLFLLVERPLRNWGRRRTKLQSASSRRGSN